ncbi:hypothetical protein QO002_002350 [Pararhizobium capsulatum DSM 1112]|uniref:Uncharacterized protein n=1 Tax=Pararhizobium capsulatum DSM 1112 TaxID=1121113 RepID=A0ABU0BTN1_9HYPH|nr:hypothetical protein [Pararhizobium capsulatum]MDQ0320212.1 hypothetical protein [Pararhizobium capsulatum DSM 1112]
MAWIIVIVCVVLALSFYTRMKARAEADRLSPDAGQALLDFGRAFPSEAIRAIHSTRNDQAYFVRLHDGKAGFMASHGTHFVCHLIEPGRVQVTTTESGRGLKVHFSELAHLDGDFEFRSGEIAAEVALWLLGSFQPRSEFTPQA